MTKKYKLLQVPMLVPFDGQTLILRKIMQRKAFLEKPRHQYHVSKWIGLVYGG